MNISDIKECASYFKSDFIDTFYIVLTYSHNAYIFIGEEGNFPHLVGVSKDEYHRAYRNAADLFQDLIQGRKIRGDLFRKTISRRSKQYKKMQNFQNSTDLFWRQNGFPMIVHYDKTKLNTLLDHVDELLMDFETGYMLGWTRNHPVLISPNIKLQKYCICSWIDESGAANPARKEKYLYQQNFEMVQEVISLDQNSSLIQRRPFSYTREQKIRILQMCERNQANLCVDLNNAWKYIELAESHHINCMINGVVYPEELRLGYRSEDPSDHGAEDFESDYFPLYRFRMYCQKI